MLNTYKINFTEYKATIFGTGQKKIETQKGQTENNTIQNFLKYKKTTGKLIVINTIQLLPE